MIREDGEWVVFFVERTAVKFATGSIQDVPLRADRSSLDHPFGPGEGRGDGG